MALTLKGKKKKKQQNVKNPAPIIKVRIPNLLGKSGKSWSQGNMVIGFHQHQIIIGLTARMQTTSDGLWNGLKHLKSGKNTYLSLKKFQKVDFIAHQPLVVGHLIRRPDVNEKYNEYWESRPEQVAK